jgi:urease accessory protein
MDGYLNLTVGVDSKRHSYLRKQAFRAPFHISKPYWDDRVLTVQIINPTAGLFSYDSLESHVEIETDASALLTAPSASRVHTSRGGWSEVRQWMQVKTGGWLEYHPPLLIPQKGAKYRQRSEVQIDEGGEMFFMETLAPGRVARQECFEFDEIDWTSNFRYAGDLVLRERYSLNPLNGSLNALRQPIENAYFAGGVVITKRLANDCVVWKQIRDLHRDKELLVGVSEVSTGVWSLKLLAADSIGMRKCVQQIRSYLSAFIPELKTVARMN